MNLIKQTRPSAVRHAGASLALGVLLLGGAALSTAAQAQVSVSVGVNQPGVYGRVDIGNAPPPPLIYQQPVIISPPRMPVERRPIYLRVPQGYESNWARYCSRYEACGQPVYFVRNEPRPPAYRNDRGPRGHDRHDDRGHGHGRGDDRGHDNGRGHGRGHDR